jgi:hypothetical protein
MFPLPGSGAIAADGNAVPCLPNDAYPSLDEIEKPQVWLKTRQPMRYKNSESHLIDLSWFLELEEELGLFGKITLCFPCPGNSGRVGTV